MSRPEPPFAGRRALVTGGASGIGLAIARRLAHDGADVTVADRVVTPEFPTLTADLTERSDVERLLADAGPVDILVNNAGFQHVAPVDEFPVEQWDAIIAVMLTAPFLLARGMLAHMVEAGWGRVINIASVHGLVASPYKAAYVAAKHGVIGLTKTIALEAAVRCPDVTAHAICPSYTRTPLVEAQIESQAQVHGTSAEAVIGDVMLDRNAVKRLIEPEQVAELVAFVCGPSAWTMTGSALTMDAGWLAH